MAFARFIIPGMFKRDKQRQRFAELRQRDGDNCRRCRRPMSFDLPPGHDQAATILQTGPKSKGAALDALCLCHVRCHGVTVDNTSEVQERLRLRAEAAVAPKRRVAGRR